MNLALVLDGSGSVGSSDFALEQDFAIDAVAAFADRNLFDNGGMASYVQYAKVLASSATFDSAQDFNDFVGADKQVKGGTTTSIGIAEGTRLLGVNPASASFMIVITDGKSSSVSATKNAADAARAEGIVVFAVGVGECTSHGHSCRHDLCAEVSRLLCKNLCPASDQEDVYLNKTRIEHV